MRAVVDGEMEGNGAVGVVNSLEMLHIITAGGVNRVVPSVGFASSGIELVGCGIVDSEMEGVHLSTSVVIQMAVNVVSGSGVCLTVSIRPSVGVVSGYREGLVSRFVDSEMQSHHAVTAVGGLKRNGGLVGAFGISDTVYPSVAVAGGLLVGARGGLVDAQGNRLLVCGCTIAD